MRRTVFNEDHEAFRETLRAFIEAEVVPVYDDWFAAGQAPRDRCARAPIGMRVDRTRTGNHIRGMVRRLFITGVLLLAAAALGGCEKRIHEARGPSGMVVG